MSIGELSTTITQNNYYTNLLLFYIRVAVKSNLYRLELFYTLVYRNTRKLTY